MNIHTISNKLNTQLKLYSNPKRAEHNISYINSSLPSYGCSLPNVRKITSTFFSELSDSHIENRGLMNTLWNSANNLELSFIPLFYFQKRKKINDLDDWEILKTWIDRVDNWTQADYYADIIADIHERYPKEILPILISWNIDDNPWKRRLSLTGLFYYARQRKTPPKLHSTICLIKARLHDENAYVQKAVGWTLREAHQFYPEDIEHFVEIHARDLSAYAFQASTEKWSKEKKLVIKNLRKAS